MSETRLTRILFVEDEPDIQVVARISLELMGGFIVKVCGSGTEALDEGPSFGPDLVLLDVMLPGLDGMQTFAAMRRTPELAEVPVVFMSARVQPQEIAEYRQMGALDVIAKPFDPMTLAATIRTIWRTRHDRAEAESAG